MHFCWLLAFITRYCLKHFYTLNIASGIARLDMIDNPSPSALLSHINMDVFIKSTNPDRDTLFRQLPFPTPRFNTNYR